MVSFEPFEEGVEARGETILVIEEALSRFSDTYQRHAREALHEFGIENPDPDEWYLQEAELNALEAMAEELEPHILDRVGEQIPDAAEWPGRINGVAEGLRSIDEAYQLNHRGGEIGHYRFEKLDGNQGRLECRNPYPCPFDRGLIRSVAREYSPVQSFVFVEEPGNECRRDGADACTYVVHW